MTPPKPRGWTPADETYGSTQMFRHLDIPAWKWHTALRHGLADPPDRDGRWSAGLLAKIAERLPDILNAVGPDPELTAPRAADRVSERLDLEVVGEDIMTLGRSGALLRTGRYHNGRTWDCYDLDRLTADVVEPVMGDRLGWLATSIDVGKVRTRMGLSVTGLHELLDDRGIFLGPFRRLAQHDVDALMFGQRHAELVRGERRLGRDQAAEHLELHPDEVGHCLTVGWVEPAEWVEIQLSRRLWVDVPIYRQYDVDSIRSVAGGAGLAVVRATRPGEPSPLWQYAVELSSRTAVVRQFATDLSARYRLKVTAEYNPTRARWCLRWAPDAGGAPTTSTVRAELLADLKPHAHAVDLRAELPADDDDVPSGRRS